MKTVIVALNSKYIHGSLAPWYLKYACGDDCGQVKVLEYNINDNIEWILTKIVAEKPDVAAFSCYIWNIEIIFKIISNIKKVLPNVKIVLGGPEVSYTPEEIMKSNSYIDFIICGEGEDSFKKLLSVLNVKLRGDLKYQEYPKHLRNIDYRVNSDYEENIEEANIRDIDGLCYREGGKIHYNGKYCIIKDLGALPSPYTNEMLSLMGSNKIIYYEASRGCPFSCSYCISSTFEGVRYFPMERVKSDLLKLINAGVKQVKFVDRTFNCNNRRAKEIIRYVIENSKKTNFHFEAAGDLFDDELIRLLLRAPEGIIQLEIGVQSINTQTHSEIRRKTDINKLFDNVRKLRSKDNIHIHLDLIAGLPFEDYSSFKQSFDAVYSLEPHYFQLGFLKLLKGSYIRTEEQVKKHQYEFREYPPYEVLCNKYISFSEIAELKGIEEVLERYYNSGRFENTLRFIINCFYSSPFEFYKELYLYNLEHGYLDKSISARDQYTVFVEFVEYLADKLSLKESVGESLKNVINDLLKFDFMLTNNTGKLPERINRVTVPGFKDWCRDFLKDESHVRQYLPDFVEMSPGQILNKVKFEIFDYDVAALSDKMRLSDKLQSSGSVSIIDDNKLDDNGKLDNYNKSDNIGKSYDSDKSYDNSKSYDSCRSADSDKLDTSNKPGADCNSDYSLNSDYNLNIESGTTADNLMLPEQRRVIILFDYSNQHKVTGRYRYEVLKLKNFL